MTPKDIANALRYNGGLKNFHLDIVSFSGNYLDKIFGDKGSYYGKLKQRLTQVFPTNVAEICVNIQGKYEIFVSSALPPLNFTNGVVKKVDKYIQINKDCFEMGFKFFKNLAEHITKVLVISNLPEVENDNVFTHSEVMEKSYHQLSMLIETEM